MSETYFRHPKTGEAVLYGPNAICTTVASILEEVRRARGMFAVGENNFAALIEEVGELANALIEHKAGKASEEAVFKEAVQVAAMAIRVIEEGSPEFPYRGPRPPAASSIPAPVIKDGPDATSDQDGAGDDGAEPGRRTPGANSSGGG